MALKIKKKSELTDADRKKRSEEAKLLAYPSEPKEKNKAKIWWKSTPYRFGEHGSRESVLLFYAWQKHLIETGEALPIATIKADSRFKVLCGLGENSDDPPPQVQSRWHSTLLAISVGLIAVGITCPTTIGIMFLMKSDPVPQEPVYKFVAVVDDIPMNEDEVAGVRAIRSYEAKRNARRPKVMERAAELQSMFREDEGNGTYDLRKIHEQVRSGRGRYGRGNSLVMDPREPLPWERDTAGETAISERDHDEGGSDSPES